MSDEGHELAAARAELAEARAWVERLRDLLAPLDDPRGDRVGVALMHGAPLARRVTSALAELRTRRQ